MWYTTFAGAWYQSWRQCVASTWKMSNVSVTSLSGLNSQNLSPGSQFIAHQCQAWSQRVGRSVQPASWLRCPLTPSKVSTCLGGDLLALVMEVPSPSVWIFCLLGLRFLVSHSAEMATPPLVCTTCLQTKMQLHPGTGWLSKEMTGPLWRNFASFWIGFCASHAKSFSLQQWPGPRQMSCQWVSALMLIWSTLDERREVLPSGPSAGKLFCPRDTFNFRLRTDSWMFPNQSLSPAIWAFQCAWPSPWTIVDKKVHELLICLHACGAWTWFGETEGFKTFLMQMHGVNVSKPDYMPFSQHAFVTCVLRIKEQHLNRHCTCVGVVCTVSVQNHHCHQPISQWEGSSHYFTVTGPTSRTLTQQPTFVHLSPKEWWTLCSHVLTLCMYFSLFCWLFACVQTKAQSLQDLRRVALWVRTHPYPPPPSHRIQMLTKVKSANSGEDTAA